jgi:hypothetical protein
MAVHYSFVGYHHCHEGDIAVQQSHLCCRIWVRDCTNRAIGIPFGIQDLNVGKCLLVVEYPIDCRGKLLVHSIRDTYPPLSSYYQPSFSHARSRCQGGAGAWAGKWPLTLR